MSAIPLNNDFGPVPGAKYAGQISADGYLCLLRVDYDHITPGNRNCKRLLHVPGPKYAGQISADGYLCLLGPG